MKTFTRCMMILGILFAFSTAHAASKEELRKRQEERHPKLQELKKSGVIGEASDGYVAVREGKDKKVDKLVDEENADRKATYELFAKEDGISVKTVAERAAKLNFEKAKSGEYLKDKDGKWTKKA